MNRRDLLKLLPAAAGSTLFTPCLAAPYPIPAGDPTPVYIAPGEGEKFASALGEITFKLGKEQTLGILSTHEDILNPGFLAAPPHFHRNFDEICFVQQGSLHVLSGETVVEVPAGGWHFRPRGIVHTFWNSGDSPCKSIQLFTPAGFEEYLKAMLKLTIGNPHPDRDAIRQLALKYDVVVRHDLLQGVIDKYGVHL